MREELLRIISADGDASTREASIRAALKWAEAFILRGLERGDVLLTLTRPRRSKDQNKKLWPMLHDISVQVKWGGRYLSEAKWKDLFSALLRKQDYAPSLDGDGVVFFGVSTSRMTVAEFSDLIEVIYAWGSDHGVEWSNESRTRFRELRRVA